MRFLSSCESLIKKEKPRLVELRLLQKARKLLGITRNPTLAVSFFLVSCATMILTHDRAPRLPRVPMKGTAESSWVGLE